MATSPVAPTPRAALAPEAQTLASPPQAATPPAPTPTAAPLPETEARALPVLAAMPTLTASPTPEPTLTAPPSPRPRRTPTATATGVPSPTIPQAKADQRQPTAAATSTITLAFTGDVMLGRAVDRVIAEKGFGHPWGNVLPRLKEVDLLLINLETTITSETIPKESKRFYFRADPSVIETLEIGRVDFASVANNHILDFGPEGLKETLDVLDRADVAHAGAGIDLPSAERPVVLTVNGTRIGIVAYADYPPHWAAGPGSPGINYTPISTDPAEFAGVERALSALRQEADLVIFSIHWGPNWRARPTETFRQFARRVVEAGADIFWGHSAHVVQGVETHDGKLILYDTGDFVDDYVVDEELRNDLSALFLVTVTEQSIERLDLVPVQIHHGQVNLAEDDGLDWIVDRLTALSEELGTGLVDAPHGLSLPLSSR